MFNARKGNSVSEPDITRVCDQCGETVTEYVESFFAETTCLACLDAVEVDAPEDERGDD